MSYDNTDAMAQTTTPWTGASTLLAVAASPLLMAQTTNGSMVFAAQNMATTNDAGQVQLTTGGNPPSNVPVPALQKQPTIQVNNWGGNNLQVFNNSTTKLASIQVAALGPGLPGLPAPKDLSTNPSLVQNESAQGTTSPQWQTLRLQNNSNTNAVIAIIGGPVSSAGINAYVISLNSPSGDTGQASGKAAAPPTATTGFYATVAGNTFDFLFNWQSSYVMWVANMSAISANSVTLTFN